MPDFVNNGVLIAIVAHGLVGASLIWDKVLLKKRGTKNLFSYVFWMGAISIFGLLLLPFGYHASAFRWIAVAFVAGLADLAASFFYYKALKSGEASEALAIMGGFTPVATFAFAYLLLAGRMTNVQLMGFALMTFGGFVMFFSEKLPIKQMLPMVLLTAVLFGLANVLQKLVYNHTNFVTGFVWFTIGTFMGSLSLLVVPSWRRQILANSGERGEPRNRFWYFVNRFMAGVGSFLVMYAISRANPAIVNAVAGVRYAVIFLGAFLLTKFRPMWLKETFCGSELAGKSIATLFVIAGLAVVGLAGGNKGGAGPAALWNRSRFSSHEMLERARNHSPGWYCRSVWPCSCER
jgi:drug/metabolite transporter (DMT)-like permease